MIKIFSLILTLIPAVFAQAGLTQSHTGENWPGSDILFAAEKTRVAGHADGVPVKDMYQCFREPVVVQTQTGRIVVGCHAGNKLEWPERSGQDYVIRYSDNGGVTWSEPILVAEHGNFSVQSHGMVYDAMIERIIVKYIVYRFDYSKVEGRGLKAAAPVIKEQLDAGEDFQRAFQVFSDDGGQTWSKPEEIEIGDKHDMPHYGSSEGRQLTLGQYKGRLIIPGGMRVEDLGNVIRKRVGIWYSDDHGEEWKFVEIYEDNPGKISCEARVSELQDGSLLYNVRTGYNSRYLARSTNGGKTWSKPKSHPDLVVTGCNGSMLTLRDKSGNLTSDLLFSIPSPGGRKDGWIYVSKDDGQSWKIKHQPVNGYFAYSAIIQTNPKTVCLFYEANHYKDIRLMRIPIARLLGDKKLLR